MNGKCRPTMRPLIFVLLLIFGARVMAMEPLPTHYAESVMVGALSDDGSREVSVRLARFPEKKTATIWLQVANSDGAWSVADEALSLKRPGATLVKADEVSFSAADKVQSVTFSSSGRNSDHIQGRVVGTFMVAATRHPDLGKGTLPISLDLAFEADSEGFRTASNRWEMTGKVHGSFKVNGKVTAIDASGTWHEQIGPRASFAPAFTYFNIQGGGNSILVVDLANGPKGYALRGEKMSGINSFHIDAEGATQRRFEIVLADNSRIHGTARVVQSWSVPIEGKRRPGSAILVETNLGPMLGTLNDWDPKKASKPDDGS